MGLIGGLSKSILAASAAGTASFFIVTRNSKFVPFDPADPILSSEVFKRLNPEKNPALKDLCIRKVPISKIKPILLEGDGSKLPEAFCAGVFSGDGYAFQRKYLARKYEGPSTAHQLWTRAELASSKYEPGTQLTDHFEVVTKTPTAITVRCGDSPLKRDVRPSDGLFELSAVVEQSTGEVRFGLKSVLFQGLGKATYGPDGPMPPHIAFLHRQYAKLWMETALDKVMQ